MRGWKSFITREGVGVALKDSILTRGYTRWQSIFIYILRGGGRHLDSIFDERKYTVALYSICTMCEEA